MIYCDLEWCKKDVEGVLCIVMQDVVDFGFVMGDVVCIMMEVGFVEVIVEVLECMVSGYVFLFNGFGFDYFDEYEDLCMGWCCCFGVVLNELIFVEYCDLIVGMFWYKLVFVCIEWVDIIVVVGG